MWKKLFKAAWNFRLWTSALSDQDVAIECASLSLSPPHSLSVPVYVPSFYLANVSGGQVLPSIDAVLISHPDTAHLGALPYLVGHHGLRAPIYATSALQKMGQMFLYDQYLSHHATTDFGLYTLDDVDEAFRLIICLKYHQNVPLAGEAFRRYVTIPSHLHSWTIFDTELNSSSSAHQCQPFNCNSQVLPNVHGHQILASCNTITLQMVSGARGIVPQCEVESQKMS